MGCKVVTTCDARVAVRVWVPLSHAAEAKGGGRGRTPDAPPNSASVTTIT